MPRRNVCDVWAGLGQISRRSGRQKEELIIFWCQQLKHHQWVKVQVVFICVHFEAHAWFSLTFRGILLIKPNRCQFPSYWILWKSVTFIHTMIFIQSWQKWSSDQASEKLPYGKKGKDKQKERSYLSNQTCFMALGSHFDYYKKKKRKNLQLEGAEIIQITALLKLPIQGTIAPLFAILFAGWMVLVDVPLNQQQR